MKIISAIKVHLWIIVILTAGVGYLLILQWLTPDGVFFSRDSGLKAMLSQNLALDHFGFNLQFPDQPWIKALWADGLLPYQEPFVYHQAGGYYITFPYTFPLVTAPFYAFWGYRGLYVIPCLATLVIWLVFYWVCKKMELSAAVIAIGAAFLIFSSNLIIYGALYWEHTLSVCLSFAGLSLVFPPKGSKSISFRAAAWAGILSGLAVWFRPEQIFLVVFIDFLSLVALVKPRWDQFSYNRCGCAGPAWCWGKTMGPALFIIAGTGDYAAVYHATGSPPQKSGRSIQDAQMGRMGVGISLRRIRHPPKSFPRHRLSLPDLRAN